MNVKSVEKENGKAKVVVEIDKPEFEQALNKAYAKCRKDIMLPGFRKGKAPRKMVESMYGATVFYEDAVNEIFPEIYTTAIVDQQLKAVGSPSVSNMDTPDEGGVVLTIETELYPEVTLGQYKGIEVPKREVKVEESEVDAEVNRMAERNARIETVDRAAQMGDTVVIDFEGFEGGKPFQGGKAEDYSLTLGSGSFIPGFEEALVGAVAGEARDVNVTFPETMPRSLPASPPSSSARSTRSRSPSSPSSTTSLQRTFPNLIPSTHSRTTSARASRSPARSRTSVRSSPPPYSLPLPT